MKYVYPILGVVSLMLWFGIGFYVAKSLEGVPAGQAATSTEENISPTTSDSESNAHTNPVAPSFPIDSYGQFLADATPIGTISPFFISGQQNSGPEIAPDLGGDEVVFAEGAFSVRVPEGWKDVDASVFAGGDFQFTNPKRAFVNASGTCVLVFAQKPRVPYQGSYPSNPVRLMSVTGVDAHVPATRFMPTQYVSMVSATPTLMYEGVDMMHSPYRPYEFIAYGFSTPQLYLVPEGGSTLSEDCVSNGRSIIQSMRRDFVSGDYDSVHFLALAHDRLTPSSGVAMIGYDTGEMQSFASSPFGFVSRAVFSEHTQVLYAGRTYDVQVVDMDRPAFSLQVLDASNGFSLPDGSQITDLFPYGNLLFVTAGSEGCMEYKGNCSARVLVYDMSTKKMSTLTESYDFDTIEGITADGSELLVSNRFGDAGCWSAEYAVVHIASHTVTGKGRFGGCFDDETGAMQETPEVVGDRNLRALYGAAQRFEAYVLSKSQGVVTPVYEPPVENSLPMRLSRKYYLDFLPMRVIP